ncbi:DUF1801 domain-containing protein [Chryseobacterium sp. G0162]|uniref:DUF1801 domain-containing protein n=1 Tax=Chryseobacterium nakagawai TaxID=1241982 RepID=A0AAD0YRT0_CHRNA|nr:MULTISPECIES: DUF1801 domain-containing protein [Chryseobacterium]AZA91921.1 DUF1801 domain-containing protein [Chryseobacterium nakagawai]AZB09157.1 DUF1801 domain-containing protein [Chryseobacterium sp. G0162]VEH18443.1 Uncharacterized conserved protein [Chryseobacterium nakagawai]
MNPIQEYFYRIEEPERSTLLFLRETILASDPENITETFSFGLPFIKYKKKMLCYFYYSKKYKKHYLSFYHGDKLDYPELVKDGRKKFKILLINTDEDLPVSLILEILTKVKDNIKG